MDKIRINYIDASAIVKLLVKEDRSQEVIDYFNNFSVFLTTSLCFAEALGVLSAKYKRDHLKQEEYLCACETLLALLRDCRIEIHDVSISKREVFDEVEKEIDCYQRTKNKRLDVSDAFQLVTLKRVFCDVERSSVILVTADQYLAEVVRNEGLCAWYVMKESPPSC